MYVCYSANVQALEGRVDLSGPRRQTWAMPGHTRVITAAPGAVDCVGLDGCRVQILARNDT